MSQKIVTRTHRYIFLKVTFFVAYNVSSQEPPARVSATEVPSTSAAGSSGHDPHWSMN